MSEGNEVTSGKLGRAKEEVTERGTGQCAVESQWWWTSAGH